MQHQPTPHICAWEGCAKEGTFRAPKDRHCIGSNRPEDYCFYCDEHIKAFNRAWDYFAGMSEEDIIRFQDEAIHGHRPTWQRDRVFEYTPNREEALKAAFARFEGRTYQQPKAPDELQRNRQEREALAVLDLPEDAQGTEIKARYKQLVKTLHPDANHGNKASEERFKRVAEAYQTIKHLT